MATPHCNETFAGKEVQSLVDCSLARVHRYQTGRWTIYLQVDITIQLPDGRVIHESREVPLGGVLQRGRKHKGASDGSGNVR